MNKKNVLNLNSMKNINIQTVLNALRCHGQISRAELSRSLNCDSTTITNIIRSLSKQNLVKSHGSVAGARAGRPKELLTLNSTAGYCIGLSFDPESIHGIVVDLAGKIVLRRQVHYKADITQIKFLALLKKISKNLFNDIAGKKLIGIGIATFGPLDPRSKIISNTERFPAVNNLDLKEYFYKNFKLTPEVIDATATKTMTEIWNDSRQADKKDFILIDAGIGIGAVIVKKGIIDRKEKYFGEFGHTVILPDGEKCTCGMRGCLETVAPIPAIEKTAAAALSCETITFDSIIERYQTGDPVITKVVDDSAKWLGLAVANLINLLIPDKIILCGALFELGNSYICKLQRTVNEFTFPLFRGKGVVIQQSIYGKEAAAIGAANYLLYNFFYTVNSVKLTSIKQAKSKTEEIVI